MLRSNEERIAKMVRLNKEAEARETAKRRQKEIQVRRAQANGRAALPPPPLPSPRALCPPRADAPLWNLESGTMTSEMARPL